MNFLYTAALRTTFKLAYSVINRLAVTCLGLYFSTYKLAFSVIIRYDMRLVLLNRMGRGIAFDCWSCDLICAASSPDIYIINLELVC